MTADGWYRAPWVVNNSLLTNAGFVWAQSAAGGIQASQAFPLETPPEGTGPWPGGPLLGAEIPELQLTLAGLDLFQVLIEEAQQHRLGFGPPLQMGGRSDVQFRPSPWRLHERALGCGLELHCWVPRSQSCS